jgi:hypothetical protein
MINDATDIAEDSSGSKNDATDSNATIISGAAAKSSDICNKGGYLRWTDDMLYLFIKECRIQKVHKSEESMTMEQKWNLVLAALKTSPLFIALESNKTTSIKKKLSDEKKRCKAQYGISDSCINLSGLSAKPNKIDQIILEMITDQNCKNLTAKRKREEKQVKRRVLNGIVSDELTNQGGPGQFVGNIVYSESESPRQPSSDSMSSFLTPLQSVQRSRNATSSLDSSTSSRTGHIIAGDQFIEAQTRRLEDAIRSTMPQQRASDPERERLEAEILQDEAATKRLNRQIAELQLAKLQREMGLL